MIHIAVFGAGGAMGTRASQALVGDPQFHVLHVEPADAGKKRLAERGITPVSRYIGAKKQGGAWAGQRFAESRLFSIVRHCVIEISPKTTIKK